MGELANCPKCGKLFVKNVNTICPACVKEEEKMYDKVYRFIKKRENREATILEVHEGTGVPEEVIIRFIKEGRLRVGHLTNLTYKCEKCEKPIRTGRVCKECSKQISNELNQYDKFQKRLEEQRKKPTYLSDKEIDIE